MNIQKLYQSRKTVFRVDDLLLLLETDRAQTVRNFLQRMKKKGVLRMLCGGVWAFPSYNVLELACKLKQHSYVSCETVLKQSGIIFQYYGTTVTCVSDNSIVKECDGRSFVYRKLCDHLRFVPEGIEYCDGYSIACAERALCDMIYLSPSMYFDDVSGVDWERAFSLGAFFPSRVLVCLKQLAYDR